MESDEDDLQPDSPPKFVEEIDIKELGVLEVRSFLQFVSNSY